MKCQTSQRKVIIRDLQNMEIPLVYIYIYIDFAQLVPQRKRKQKRKKEERMLNKMHNART